jgi:hypothetical protein
MQMTIVSGLVKSKLCSIAMATSRRQGALCAMRLKAKPTAETAEPLSYGAWALLVNLLP